jgi:hypothetical protein
MLYLAPAVGVAAGLGAITAYHWSWVVLLAFWQYKSKQYESY